MPIEKLISYPFLPTFMPEFLDAFNNSEVCSETLFKYGKVRDLRSTISVRLLMDSADPVFVMGEALQAVEDEFNRHVGVSIADGRAMSRKTYHKDANWCIFTLSQAEDMVEDYLERKEDTGDIMKVSSVRLPLSGLHLPHGIVNRLKMLVPRKED